MRPDIGRHHLAPRLFRARYDERGEDDGNWCVVGLRGDVGEHHRDGMFAGVAAFQARRLILRFRAGVTVRDVGVRGGPVVVIRVIVTRVRVDVLPHRRPGGREHSHGDERGEHAMHCRESMGNADFGQTGETEELVAGLPGLRESCTDLIRREPKLHRRPLRPRVDIRSQLDVRGSLCQYSNTHLIT